MSNSMRQGKFVLHLNVRWRMLNSGSCADSRTPDEGNGKAGAFSGKRRLWSNSFSTGKWFWESAEHAAQFGTKSVDDVAAALRSGAMKPGEVSVNYIVRDGQTIMLNTRSAQALEAAGIPRSQWNGVNDFTFFLMHHRDHASPALNDVRKEAVGANLNWLGARWMGAFHLGKASLLGYWLDAAWLRGSERNVRDEDVARKQGGNRTLAQRSVRGHAVDFGINWSLSLPMAPRLFGGYAIGSGGDSPPTSVDRAFRQSGIQANESGFGGVRRYPHYGLLLQPELSNLKITTVGTGISVLKSSSLDIVYHHYAQASATPSLRGAKLEATPTGAHRDVGAELDLVFAIEEWQKLELELGAAAFRTGRAFGPDEGSWIYRAFVTMRFSF